MEELKNVPFTEWLEKSVRELYEGKAEHIAICAMLPSNEVFTAYWDCSAQDKGVIANNTIWMRLSTASRQTRSS